MSGDLNGTWQRILSVAKGTLRFLLVSSTSIVIIAGVVIFIFWSADPFEARDRWERLSLAVSGDWELDNWCPPGTSRDTCDERDAFLKAFGDMDDYTFTKSTELPEMKLVIHRGVSFEDIDDVLARRPIKHWCDARYVNAEIEFQIHFTAQGFSFSNASGNSKNTSLAEINLSNEQLSEIAQEHCRFDYTVSRGGRF